MGVTFHKAPLGWVPVSGMWGSDVKTVIVIESVCRDPDCPKSTRPGLVAEHSSAVDTERRQTMFQA